MTKLKLGALPLLGWLLIAVMTAAHFGINLEAYTPRYAVFIVTMYALALLALFYIAVDGIERMTVIAFVAAVLMKVAIASGTFGWVRGDESRIWEFTDAAHAMYANSPLLYTLMHDAGALFLIVAFAYIAQLRNQTAGQASG